MPTILNFINIKSNDNESYDKITLINKLPINIYTDGACSNNGNVNAIAGIGIYFGKEDKRNVSEKIIGKQSNNTAELTALIKLFQIIGDDRDNKYTNQIIHIYTDSMYAIRCCKEYGLRSFKNQWKKKTKYIPNHELVKQAYELFNTFKHISLFHIKAHSKKTDEYSIGNMEADKLASQSIKPNPNYNIKNMLCGDSII